MEQAKFIDKKPHNSFWLSGACLLSLLLFPIFANAQVLDTTTSSAPLILNPFVEAGTMPDSVSFFGSGLFSGASMSSVAGCNLSITQYATSTATTPSSINVSLNNVATSSLLVVSCAGYNSASWNLSSISDNKSNTYHLFASSTYPIGGGAKVFGYYATSTTGGNITVTCTFSGALAGDAYMGIVEVSSTDLNNPLDHFIENVTGTTTNVNTGNITATNSCEFHFSSLMNEQCTTITPKNTDVFNTAITIPSSACNDRSGGIWFGIASSSGSFDTGATLSASTWWSGISANFFQSSSGTSTPTSTNDVTYTLQCITNGSSTLCYNSRDVYLQFLIELIFFLTGFFAAIYLFKKSFNLT